MSQQHLQTINATSERVWPHNYLALLDHCTHVVDLGHDLQDHVQLRILKKSANRNELQIKWASIVEFIAIRPLNLHLDFWKSRSWEINLRKISGPARENRGFGMRYLFSAIPRLWIPPAKFDIFKDEKKQTKKLSQFHKAKYLLELKLLV